MDSSYIELPCNCRARIWKSEDREIVGEIIKEILESYGFPFEPDNTDKDALLVEEYYIRDNRGEFWVVETHSGRIVGTAAFYESNKGDESVEIRRMYLVPEMRGKGLGKALLNLIEQRIKAKGYVKVYIKTASVMKEACIMY